MFDCTLVAVRRKEDPWNSIAAGALTGGVLQLRTGLQSAARSAAFGGVLLVCVQVVLVCVVDAHCFLAVVARFFQQHVCTFPFNNTHVHTFPQPCCTPRL